MRDYFVTKQMFYSFSIFHPLVQHPLMLGTLIMGVAKWWFFSHHHSFSITWCAHIKTSVTLFPFIYLLISEWMNVCLFYLIGYNSLSLLFNLMPSLFKWEVLLFGFWALFTCPYFFVFTLFLACQAVSGASWTVVLTNLKSAISFRTPGSFYCMTFYGQISGYWLRLLLWGVTNPRPS